MTDSLVPLSQYGDETNRVEIYERGAIVKGTPTFELLEKLTIEVVQSETHLQFVIGDLINAGEKHFGKRYKEVIDATGYSPQTLYNMASVCRRIPIENRIYELSWTIYAEAASLTSDEQLQVFDIASREGWTAQDVRKHLSARRKELTPGHDTKAVFGEPINFRGLQHAPVNEQGVVYLFGMISRELGFLIESIRTKFPDCEGKRCIDEKLQRWVRVLIEFEYRSSNFREHDHNPAGCDLIVCWIHDWQDAPIEVLELRSQIELLSNR